MKLYIPVSSLNFNNILSTESISPKGFYGERNFGYSRWFDIPENNLTGIVLLYEEAHTFVRPKSDMEDHPLLIEIDTEEEYPIYSEKIRYSNKTIYLDPWHTHFIFFDSQDKRVALSLSDSSLETKVVRLYQQHMIVTDKVEGQYAPLSLHNDIPINRTNIEYDIRINKYKGFLYGYYIGALLSVNKNDLANLNVLREIINIYSSILSSSDKMPSYAQEIRLVELLKTFSHQEPLFKGIQNIVKNEHMADLVCDFLRKSGLYHSVNYQDVIESLKNGSIEDNESVKWIKDKLERLEKDIKDKRQPLQPVDAEIIVSDGKLFKLADNIITDDDLKSIYIGWINEVLAKPDYDSKVSAFKDVLSDELTGKAKDVLGDRWENHIVRTYLNQLRKHVRGGAFNQEWNEDVLSAIACCLLKGDDWTSLLKFAQTKGLTDYRLVLSFYGILNGFANLTRDFTDLLLNLPSTYVSEVYTEFAGQLFDKNVSSVVKQVEDNEKQTEKSQMSQIPNIIETIPAIDEYQNDISTKIIDFFTSPAFKYKGKRDGLEAGLKNVLSKVQRGDDIVAILFALNEYGGGWSKNNKPWQILQQEFAPDLKFATSKSKEDKKKLFAQKTLFDSNEQNSLSVRLEDSSPRKVGYSSVSSHEKLFVWDKSCIDLLADLIPTSIYQKFKEDLLWFQNEYAKGERSDYYAKASRENSPCINAFERYIGKKSYADKLNIELIVSKLRLIYAR